MIYSLFMYAALAANSIDPLSKTCFEDAISKVSSDGKVVTTASGHYYQIDDYGAFDSRFWLPAETILICRISAVQAPQLSTYEITNVDEGGEPLWAGRID